MLTTISLRSYLLCLTISACSSLGTSSTQPILSDGTPLRKFGFSDVSDNGALLKTYLRKPPAFGNTTSQHETINSITIYIEGDGAAWVAKQFAPTNPTPSHALSAELAKQDPGLLVAYLGRPCQFLDQGLLKSCHSDLWTSGRFSQQAISLGNIAIDSLLQKLESSNLKNLRLNLVGYSGGGAYAALLAGQRSDVDCLVTIAAPLDINAWTSLQKIAPLSSSLNPANPMTRLSRVSQSHWHGIKDPIVPPESTGSYPKNNSSADTRFNIMPLAKHTEPWVGQWHSFVQASCLHKSIKRSP